MENWAREMDARMPEAGAGEIERRRAERRREFEEEMREFDGKWEGRAVREDTETRRD